MARLFRRLAVLATAAEAARRYARNNPDKAGQYLDQAASFVDKQTKGRYSGQIDGVARKAKGLAGIPTGPAVDGPTGAGPATGALGNGNGTGPTRGHAAFDGTDLPGSPDSPTVAQPAPRPTPRPEV